MAGMEENPYRASPGDKAVKSNVSLGLPRGCLVAPGAIFSAWCLIGLVIAILRFFAASSPPK